MTELVAVWTLEDVVSFLDWFGSHWPGLVVFGALCAVIGWTIPR